MDRTAVFVDAGYLFAAGSMLIVGEKLPRGQLNLDYDAVLKQFGDLTAELTGLPLLRIYWYDGTATGPTPQQLALAYRPSVKLRLGFVNQQGQQKGVDSLVVTDLINLARNRAMADALLLTGDEDIRVGVQQAQEYGVRVHLIGIAPARDNQSGFLVQEADSVRELSLPEVQTFLTTVGAVVAPSAPASPPSSASPLRASPAQSPSSIEELAEQIAAELNAEEMEAVLKESSGGSIPAQIDRRLLTAGTQLTGATLTPAEKRRMRVAFLDACGQSAKK
jgi:hypothetical protein